MTRPLATPTPVVAAHGSLGLPQGIALYIGSVLGTGLLVLPGIAAQVAGPASVVAVVAVIVLSVPLAGTFAALAARFPDPGGVASYARRALGPTAARMTGYWFLGLIGEDLEAGSWRENRGQRLRRSRLGYWSPDRR